MIRSGRGRAVVPLVVMSLVVAACGGGDESGDEADTEVADTEVADTAADTVDDAEGADDGGGSEDEGAGDAAGEGAMAEDEMAMVPERGGTLTYLLEAESDTWDVPGANCAVSCITVMRQVMDPLTIVNTDGAVEPFLLESFEPNDDFTEFTLVMREGVVFHDGSPADGAAVQRSLQEMARGLLQGQVLADLVGGPEGVELVDEMTVKVSFERPFAAFGATIAERTGWLFAPSFWDDPDRAGAFPVGTGPFVMTEWVRGESTVVEANPQYWRTDPSGEPLPYLDSIEFRPIPDQATRVATMRAGDADANHDSFSENKEFWTTEWRDGGGQLVEPAADRETSYLMLHNGTAPFDNPEMRRALALCTDRNEYLTFRSPGSALANGPFAEGTPGYLAENGFPEFDPEAGNALLDEIGRPEEVVYGTTTDPSNLLTAELFAEMWSTNCGLNVTIDAFDQAELITKAITGGFQVFLWRNHGQGNPGLEFVWWHSRHAEGLALNFGRIRDAGIDAALEGIWATTDPTEVDTLAQEINRIFADNVYNIWLNSTEWFNAYQANVHGVGVVNLPSGNLAQTAIAGRTWLHEAWKES